MSDDVVHQTKDLLTEKLQRSGEYDKMRAMIVAASLSALQDSGESSFTNAPELLEAKEKSLVPFQVVGDWLRALGLNYTFQVLALEAGVDKKTLDAKRSTIAAAVGPAVKDDKMVPLLNQLLEQKPAAAVQQQAAAAAPTATVAPTVAPVSNLKVLPSTVGAIPMKGKEKKAEETKYEIYFFEAGTFVRFNEIDGQPLQLGDLKNCKIYCYDAVDCVTVDACEDCEIVVAACSGSIFLRDCKNLKVTVACKQLRTRDCHDMDVRLYAMTDPVVESSSKVNIRPFNLRLPNLKAKIATSKLDPAVNRFVHIYDFTPDNESLAKPHFAVHHPHHGLQIESMGANFGTPDIPDAFVAIFENRMKPSESSEAGPNKSHNIKTGSTAWVDPTADAAPAAIAAPAKEPPAPQPKPAATSAPASKPAKKDSDSDNYSDFSDDSKGTPMSSVKNESDDEF